MSNITNEWQKIKLGDISEVITNKINVSKLEKSNYISTENMLPNKGGIYEATNLPNILLTPSFQINDILVSNIRPYFKKIWYAKFSGGCSNDVLIFRAKQNTDPKFLYYVLSDDRFFRYAMSTSKGTKMPRGDKIAIMKYQVPKFDMVVQKKIAAVLSALDDKIELNNKINQNLEQQAQAIFKSWFIDFEPFGGKMPDDWKIGKLGDLVDITMGQSPDGSSYNEEKNGIVFFQGRAEFNFRFPNPKLYTTRPKRMARKNDVLMSVRAPVGDYNLAYDDCCIGRGLCAIRSKIGAQSFAFYLIWSLQKILDTFNGEGTVFGAINKKALNDLSVIIPTFDSMKCFENVCSPLDELIRSNSTENLRLAQLRDALLPKLMSGEIDFTKIELKGCYK